MAFNRQENDGSVKIVRSYREISDVRSCKNHTLYLVM